MSIKYFVMNFVYHTFLIIRSKVVHPKRVVVRLGSLCQQLFSAHDTPYPLSVASVSARCAPDIVQCTVHMCRWTAERTYVGWEQHGCTFAVCVCVCFNMFEVHWVAHNGALYYLLCLLIALKH